MKEFQKDRRLKFGWIMVSGAGVIFLITSIAIMATPLPGEEEYAGTTFSALQALSPKLANVIWHDYVAFGILLFGASFLVVMLSWKGLSAGSTMGWYSLLILGLTFLAFLLIAHIPIGNYHFLPLLVPEAIFLAGLFLAWKPIFSTR